MLIVVDDQARTNGIVNYLKNGTNHDRDAKDKRVTLFGDLDVLDQTIKIAQKKNYSETYRNIVLSFSEDMLETKTLEEITESFIKQYMSGYGSDEYVAYAEAHLPKIKEIVDPVTGQVTTRKPHIHIVFATYSPKLETRLELGHHGNRYGSDNHELGLWKNWIEERYGLESPVARTVQKDISDIVWMKDRRDAVQPLYRAIEENIDSINSYGDLFDVLKRAGCVKIVESTTKARTRYVSVTLDDGKTYRLKGPLFGRESFGGALSQIQAEVEEGGYKERKPGKFTPKPKKLEEITAKREEYITKRAAAARRRAIDREQREEIEQPQAVHTKNKLILLFFSRANTEARSIYGHEIGYNLKGLWVSKFNNQPVPMTVIKSTAKNIHVVDKGNEIVAKGENMKEQVAIMFELAIAKGWQDIHLEGDDVNLEQIMDIAKERGLHIPIYIDGVQFYYPSFSKPRQPQVTNKVINETSNNNTIKERIKHKIQEDDMNEVPEFTVQLAKRVLKGDDLLTYLQQSHGIDPKKYKTWIHQNGEQRIKCGSRNYSLTDFLTKELNLDYSSEALQLFKTIYDYYAAQYVQDIASGQSNKPLDSRRSFDKEAEKEQRKNTKSFLDKHIIPYLDRADLVRIKYNSDGSTKGKQVFETGIKTDVIYDRIGKANSYFDNMINQENIYLAQREDSMTQLIWLDDIKPENIDQTMTLIETSPNNYQSFMKLDRAVTMGEARKIREILADYYDADPAAKGNIQPMRLPGFENQKPKHQSDGKGFLVSVRQESDFRFNVDELLLEYEVQHEDLQEEEQKIDVSKHQSKLKTIDEFKHEDRSIRDFHYARYLARSGLTDQQIKSIMNEQIKDLEERKKSHSENYLDRTIIAARTRKYSQATRDKVLRDFVKKSIEQKLK